MRRLSSRTLLILAVFIFAGFVIVGCEDPTLVTNEATQVDQIGPMKINTVVEACAGSPTNTNCSPQGPLQLLVGYRVPEGSGGPESVPSSGAHDTVSTTFHKSDTYASELQRLSPAPAGEQWIGYISDDLNLDATTTDPDRETLAPAFTLPAGSAGSVFKYAITIGQRFNTSNPDATRPVVCDLTMLTSQTPDLTTCQTSTSPGGLGTDINGPTVNELGLAAGPAQTVHGGDTATVPFAATLIGPALNNPLILSASSPLSGGAAAPASAILAPATGANATSATLKVPTSAATGDYPVTLTATSGGQTRSATGTVHVLAVPGLVISFKPHSLTASKGGTVGLPISCPADSIDPCAGSVTLTTAGKVLVAKKKARKRTLKLGSHKFNVAPGASSVVKVKLTSAGRKTLARTRRLGAKATFKMTNRAGKTSVTVKRVTLHAPKVRKKHKRH